MVLSSSLHCFNFIQSLGATSGLFIVDELVHYEKIRHCVYDMVSPIEADRVLPTISFDA